MQHLRDVVDRRGVAGVDHGLAVDVAHQRDLALHGVRDRPVGAADDRVGLHADRAQRGDRVLGRLGLQLARRADVGHQRDVQEEDVVAADVVADLAGGLEERQRLDVADGAADLGDHHVDVGAGHRADPVLDLVGDVRDHLDGVAEVVAAALLGDDLGVDLAGGDVRDAGEVGVEEALVVPDVQVGLGAVVGDEHLAVLERVHRARVDVEVRVELLHRDPQPARLQQAAEAGGGEPLAQRGGDAAGDEDVLGGSRRRELRGGQLQLPWSVPARGCGGRWAARLGRGSLEWITDRPRGSTLPTPAGRRESRADVEPVRRQSDVSRAPGIAPSAASTAPYWPAWPARLPGERHHAHHLAGGAAQRVDGGDHPRGADVVADRLDLALVARRGGRAGEHHAAGVGSRRRWTRVVTIEDAPCCCVGGPLAGAGDEQHQVAAAVRACPRWRPGWRCRGRPGCWSRCRPPAAPPCLSVPTARASSAPMRS